MNVSRIGDKTLREEAPPLGTVRWLGLDPGLATLRWAVLEGEDDLETRLVDYGTIETGKKKAVSERLWELEQDLVVLIQ